MGDLLASVALGGKERTARCTSNGACGFALGGPNTWRQATLGCVYSPAEESWGRESEVQSPKKAIWTSGGTLQFPSPWPRDTRTSHLRPAPLSTSHPAQLLHGDAGVMAASADSCFLVLCC